MKKNKLVVFILLLAVIIMCSATPAKSQEKTSAASSGGLSFDGGTKLLNIGVGLGGRAYYNYGRSGPYKYRSTPAFSISYEQALPKKLGPGYLGLGGYFGFQHASYRYDYDYYNFNNNNYDKYYYKHSWNYFLIAARGAYHLDVLNWDKGEVYFGTLIGLRIQTYNFESNNPDPYYNNYRLNEGSMYPTWSFFAGGRYYFTDQIGAFMELGYGVSYLTLGATIKL